MNKTLEKLLITSVVLCIGGGLIIIPLKIKESNKERELSVKSETRLFGYRTAITFEHDGHTFILFEAGSRGIQVLHHPSCANICAKEKF